MAVISIHDAAAENAVWYSYHWLACVKVMTAASYWSLLEPALDTASLSGIYGEDGQYAFIPVSFGFAAGAAFVYAADHCLAKMVVFILLFSSFCEVILV